MIFRPNAYFAVSNPDGSFEIPNLPAGVDLQLQVWQERLSFVGDRYVTFNSPVVKDWSRRGVVTVRLEPGQDGVLEVAVKGSAFQ
jgi:hypothetical protein